MTRTLFASGAGDGVLGVVLFVSEKGGRAYAAFCALFLAPEAFRPRALLRVISEQEQEPQAGIKVISHRNPPNSKRRLASTCGCSPRDASQSGQPESQKCASV